jgi:RHS repeat-associated protein
MKQTDWVCLQNIYDYSSFGVSLDGRTVESDFYRHGYQGSEKDNETKGGGNSYTTFYRQLDPRVGRWFSIDPVTKPTFGSYNSMSNNPNIRIDPKGNDDYKLDKDGNIALKRKTKSENDKLIGTRNGLKTNKIEVSKGILNGVFGEGTGKVRIKKGETIPYNQMYVFSHEEGSVLFEFLAKNSDVEWSILKFQDNQINTSIIFTSHNAHSEMGNGDFLMNPENQSRNLIEFNHSHPGNNIKPSGSTVELDKRTSGNNDLTGDMATLFYVEDNFKSKPVFKIYTPGNGLYTTYTRNTLYDSTKNEHEIKVIYPKKENNHE